LSFYVGTPFLSEALIKYFAVASTSCPLSKARGLVGCDGLPAFRSGKWREIVMAHAVVYMGLAAR